MGSSPISNREAAETAFDIAWWHLASSKIQCPRYRPAMATSRSPKNHNSYSLQAVRRANSGRCFVPLVASDVPHVFVGSDDFLGR